LLGPRCRGFVVEIYVDCFRANCPHESRFICFARSLRNILEVPQVALLIDKYDEDWTQLWYVLIRGKAKLLPMRGHKERTWALRKLRAKYPQYAGRMLPNDAPIIRITPDRTTFWGKL
jgi:coenzyme F420-0:L-glutamate ligase / coenzyme F420-1:gamma-L-glutamate ligase